MWRTQPEAPLTQFWAPQHVQGRTDGPASHLTLHPSGHVIAGHSSLHLSAKSQLTIIIYLKRTTYSINRPCSLLTINNIMHRYKKKWTFNNPLNDESSTSLCSKTTTITPSIVSIWRCIYLSLYLFTRWNEIYYVNLKARRKRRSSKPIANKRRWRRTSVSPSSSAATSYVHPSISY